MPFTTADCTFSRLSEIAYIWRLIGHRRIHVHDAYTGINGFRIRDPAAAVDLVRSVERERIAAGACVTCGDPRLVTTRLCEHCRVLSLARVRRRLERLDAAGLCRQCARNRADTGGRCDPCREKRRAESVHA